MSAAAPPRPRRTLRILVQLPYPGYLRIYGSTIRELAARGHRVLLSYDLSEKRRDPGVAVLEALPNVHVVDPLAWQARGVGAVARWVRPAIDYLRYLDPRFAGAPYLRRRMEKFVAPAVLRASRLPLANALAPLALRVLRVVDGRLPPNPATLRALRDLTPDVVVVSPLIARGPSGVRQEDTVKAARRLRIPVAAAITSWDHLTTKGLVKALPDRVLLWNEVQRREAIELHDVPAARIVLTGAQLFDQWFELGPTSDRHDFLSRVELQPSSRYVLYVGSSPNITEPAREERFVRRWIEALRESRHADLSSLGVLVRPHPGNGDHWAMVDLAELGGAVAPRERRQLPMTDAEESFYFDSIHHAAAVVGINTSAIIEALIQRRPVLTIRAPEFQETQEGTLHFHYLVPEGGGCVRAASSLDEHLDQLAEALADPEREREAIERFLVRFVRPQGLGRAATPLLADAVEALAR